MEDNFFEKLEQFLPKHVSPLPSYAHGAVAFVVAAIVTYRLGAEHLAFDFDQDEAVFTTTEMYVQIAVSSVVSLIVADLVFSLSFKLRSFSTNKNHFTYRRWFPRLY